MTVINSILRNSIAHSIARSIAWILLLTAASLAGQPATISSYRDPAELVRKAVQNEIKAANDDTAHFLFRGTKTTPKGSTTRLYVETKEATAGLVIAYNGKALTPEQRHDGRGARRTFHQPSRRTAKEARTGARERRAHAAHRARAARCLPV